MPLATGQTGRSQFFLVFCFLSPKISTVTNVNKMQLNVCGNEMAAFGPYGAVVKGKTTLDSNDSQGGLSTRRYSGPTKYECILH